MQRRDFLKLTGLTPLLLAVPEVYAQVPAVHWERVLVLVELRGGNDGLNTVVPYQDEQYYRLRPQLAVPRQSVVQLSEQLGFNPALEPLMPVWQAHELAIVLGVGYPNPNRSHFRSIEIWDTASNSDEVLQEGWIARLFARQKMLDTPTRPPTLASQVDAARRRRCAPRQSAKRRSGSEAGPAVAELSGRVATRGRHGCLQPSRPRPSWTGTRRGRRGRGRGSATRSNHARRRPRPDAHGPGSPAERSDRPRTVRDR